MLLKKKIFLSFFISSSIIVILAAIAYSNFLEIMKEIRYLELSDTLRSKSLQLRRHEKNFFLYGDLKEIENVHIYIKELKLILRDAEHFYAGKNYLSDAAKTEDAEKFNGIYEEYSSYIEKKQTNPENNKSGYNRSALFSLADPIEEYDQRFNRIEVLFWDFHKEFDNLKPSYQKYSVFFHLIESTALERPAINAELLTNIFVLKQDNPAIRSLQKLDNEISALRKNGEEIITISKEFDKSARERVEKYINLSQKAALIFFPLFIIVGLGSLFLISHGVVRRLKSLTKAVEKTGKGNFISLPPYGERDEVGMLISAFNKMENDLIVRDGEIIHKNEELLQSKKLASIGTLASGVAHELNNPLNNIYLAAQVLSREVKQEGYPGIIKETVQDIFSQTLRVKRIVGDLLEFSREKPPELQKINIVKVISDVLTRFIASGEILNTNPNFDAPESIEMFGDKHLLEQVFINLFSNAVEAMNGTGEISIKATEVDSTVLIKVTDSGKGIPPDILPRIFDPFFTSKEKGTGLGLSIVYSIIEKHKGRIEVESMPDKGTVFTITLPR
ncbi:MAG: hypothetical protein A2X59_08365 [Nitrospirae bacterium GWC2_42_7]|nr:MAG: hypothetical protein A2X59_08365 [Nitrospirae bacterium GWC2_42_7]